MFFSKAQNDFNAQKHFAQLEQWQRQRVGIPRVLSAEFAGCELDATLIEPLPEGVYPCGENGEFHTFVFDGPMFDDPLTVEPGEVVHRDGFVFADFRLDGQYVAQP